MLWYKVPPKVYFKRGAIDLALRTLKGKKRAFVVTDRYLFNSGAIYNITRILDELDIDYQIFFDIKPNPTLSMVKEALSVLKPYEPDLIIALGGGSPMDCAKILWLMYEQPETDIETISVKNIAIEDGICNLPKLGNKATLATIPTTSGTGSEVTPFAIIRNEEINEKYILADYALTPNIAIVDPNFVDKMPFGLTAVSGMDALVHAIEAYTSNMATNFTNSNALEATKSLDKKEWKSVHVLTANDYLASRDKEENAPVYSLLGLSTGYGIPREEINSGKHTKEEKKKEYAGDIVYAPAKTVAFDYLDDNHVYSEEDELIKKPLHRAIIDEALATAETKKREDAELVEVKQTDEESDSLLDIDSLTFEDVE